MRVLVVEDEAALADRLAAALAARRLRRRLRRRRRSRGVSRPDGTLRRGCARSGAAVDRWSHPPPPLARQRGGCAGARVDGAGELARESAGHRQRRRRLRRQAVSDGGGARAPARPHPPREQSEPADAPLGRHPARSAHRRSDEGGRAGQADQPRVPGALVSHAPRGPQWSRRASSPSTSTHRDSIADRTRWKCSSRVFAASWAPAASRPCAASAIAWAASDERTPVAAFARTAGRGALDSRPVRGRRRPRHAADVPPSRGAASVPRHVPAHADRLRDRGGLARRRPVAGAARPDVARRAPRAALRGPRGP